MQEPRHVVLVNALYKELSLQSAAVTNSLSMWANWEQPSLNCVMVRAGWELLVAITATKLHNPRLEH